MPSSLLTVVDNTLVPKFFAVTSTPAITAFEESVTIPVIVARLACAPEIVTTINCNKNTNTTALLILLIPPLLSPFLWHLETLRTPGRAPAACDFIFWQHPSRQPNLTVKVMDNSRRARELA